MPTMLQESDAAELRALQLKAYGRDGGLTDADAARLHELEATRAPEPAAAAASDATAPEMTVVESTDRPVSEEVADAESADTSAPPGEAEPHTTPALRPALRQHWKAIAAASALLLVVGLAAGWALFGRAGGVELTAEQQERRAELQADGGYDAGSLRAIGQEEDVLVWHATKEDGEMVCLILDTPQDSATQCQRSEDVQNGNAVGVSVSVDSGEGEGEDAEQVWASAVRTTDGELVAIIQRWPSSQNDWLSQFPGDERVRAEELLQQGFQEYSLSVVGYFRDAPIWYGQRLEGATAEDCLVVDAIGGIACGPLGEAQSSGLSIGSATADVSGNVEESWRITLAFTSNQTPYLVIAGDAPSVDTVSPGASVKPGETLELGGEYQDPIQVEVPSDGTDG
ncbi:hypothetical protein [Microbacterium sp. CGR1]|uniref:hypothetical protein n=1 Tax=Microbacterium sp. CGR1 TaxID=1696072 RepID=UPI003DA243DE